VTGLRGLTYLDYAATSAPRPPAVRDAIVAYLDEVGATPGRSSHRLSVEAGRIALRCRLALARLLRIPGDPGRICFQPNATFALNTALRGILRPGDRVVRTVFDHNAVRRPVAELGGSGVSASVIRGAADGSLDLDEARRQIEGGAGERPARMVALPHVSSVLGSLLPVREIAVIARSTGALVLLDAAQSAGHVDVDVGALGVDLVALTGHKGLLGPQGVGALWVRDGVDVAPLALGGGGPDSFDEHMPDALPDRLEAGTLNGPGIAGLLAGIEWLEAAGVGPIHARLGGLKRRLRDGLAGIPGVAVVSPPAPDGAPIVAMVGDGLDPNGVAHRLDREFGILTRAGLHCAPETHALIGTAATGAVRFSLGWATAADDIDRALEAIRTIAERERQTSGSGTPHPYANSIIDRTGTE
jgi:cysteine desulfurase / selenocysteine lyase